MAQKNSHHKISLFSATALSATGMIGAGWLFSAQLNAKLAGNYAFVSWIVAALFCMLVGLCLSQVVGVYPVRGATTRSSALSHNKTFAMPFSFANWFGVMTVIGTEAIATTQYLSAAIKNDWLVDGGVMTFHGKMVALVILFAYVLINYFGVRLLAKINNVITVLKIFTPLFTIALFLIAKFDTSNFELAANTTYQYTSIFGAIVGAGLIYSYNSFQLAVSFASEIENPKRNVPLSIIFSLLIVMAVYMLLQLAFMGAIPHNMLASGWAGLNLHSPLMNVAMLLGLNFVVLLLIADSVVSPSGTGYSYLGGASRMYYAMAQEGQMPKWSVGRLHRRYNLCRRSVLINFVLTAVLMLNAENWASLMVVVTGYHLIGYMAAPISMGAIKPKTRLFGLIVFVLCGLVLTTLPLNDFWKMNLSLTILMLIFGFVQFLHGMKLSSLFNLSAPFLVYLWLIYCYQHLWYVVVISGLFYLIITHPTYVAYCKSHKTEADSRIDEEMEAIPSAKATG